VARRSLTLSFVLFLLCAPRPAGAAGEYRTVEVESLKIIFDSEWAQRTAPGYLPVRFDITNAGNARVIEIVAEGQRFFRAMMRPGGQPGGVDLLQTVRLARGDRVRFTVPVPILADSENLRFEIREDGRTLERFNYMGFQSRATADDAATLLVAHPSTEFGGLAASWRRVISGRTTMITVPGGSSGTMPLLDFLLDPERLPVNWLGYTSLRAVVIGSKEWAELTDPQRTALLTWTACGGDLIVVDGSLQRIVPALPDVVITASAPGVRGYFFGRIHVPTTASISASGLASMLTEAKKVQDINWALPANRTADWGTIAARGFRLPIPGVEGIPARTYLSILIVFTLVIGPLNYWFLWRQRRQVLILLTAPLISAVFILLLTGYVVAGEGFGVRGRVMSFTMLDQVRKQASTRASMSLYAAGMTPGGGLRFSRDVAVLAIGADGAGIRDRQVVDLTEGQRFAAGVIQARSPANLEQIAFRAARERLSFATDAGGISVVNGLDATIIALAYRVGGRTYAVTTPIPAGGKATLIADGKAAHLIPTGLPLSSRFDHLFSHQPEGSYLAILERSPFWEAGVPSVEERGSFHLVIGWPGGQP
jgi:hypothetical protein